MQVGAFSSEPGPLLLEQVIPRIMIGWTAARGVFKCKMLWNVLHHSYSNCSQQPRHHLARTESWHD